jgi:hypothetical protein
MGIDAAIIHAHLIEVSSAPNTDAQGRAYEANTTDFRRFGLLESF